LASSAFCAFFFRCVAGDDPTSLLGFEGDQRVPARKRSISNLSSASDEEAPPEKKS